MAWRLKTTPVRGVPDAVRVSAEPIDPDALPAPPPASAPDADPRAVGRWHTGQDAPTQAAINQDAELIEDLRTVLEARDRHIASLEQQLRERPTPAPSSPPQACGTCTGLRATVRQLRDERADLRKRLAAFELPAARERVYVPPPF